MKPTTNTSQSSIPSVGRGGGQDDDDDTNETTLNGDKCGIATNTTSSTTSKTCHKNKGRAARRRKAKARSIHLALQSLLNGEKLQQQQQQQQQQQEKEQQQQQQSPVPSDRCRPSVSVLQRRQENHVEFKKDQAILVSQLGYMPGNALGVVGRSKDLEHLYPCLHKVLKMVDDQQQNQLVAEAAGIQKKEEEGGSSLFLSDCASISSSPPTVLLLYPLALRSAFAGGKAQGRKFKSRKRGHDVMTSKTSTNNSIVHDDVHDHNDHTAENDKDNHNELQVEEPFPTIYWLTHPFLKILVSQLEIGSTHNVAQMQQRLASSKDDLSCMKLAHECYAKQRWDLLTDRDRDRISKTQDDNEKWIAQAIGTERGVAGIRKFDTVKCLHTHAAHYLAYLGGNNNASNGNDASAQVRLCPMKENLVGKWVLQTLEEVARDVKLDGDDAS